VVSIRTRFIRYSTGLVLRSLRMAWTSVRAWLTSAARWPLNRQAWMWPRDFGTPLGLNGMIVGQPGHLLAL
jgi:hypothetical protein